MTRQDIAEIVAAVTVYVIVLGVLQVVGRLYGWPFYLHMAVIYGPCYFLVKIVRQRKRARAAARR